MVLLFQSWATINSNKSLSKVNKKQKFLGLKMVSKCLFRNVIFFNKRMLYGKEGIKRNLCPLGFRISRLEIVYLFHSPLNGGESLTYFCSSRTRKMAAPNFKQEHWGKRDIYLAQFWAIFSKRYHRNPSMACQIAIEIGGKCV